MECSRLNCCPTRRRAPFSPPPEAEWSWPTTWDWARRCRPWPRRRPQTARADSMKFANCTAIHRFLRAPRGAGEACLYYYPSVSSRAATILVDLSMWGGRARLSGWACGPRIVMKPRLEGGQSCPQPPFSRLLAALQFSITCGGLSTMRRVSRPAGERSLLVGPRRKHSLLEGGQACPQPPFRRPRLAALHLGFHRLWWPTGPFRQVANLRADWQSARLRLASMWGSLPTCRPIVDRPVCGSPQCGAGSQGYLLGPAASRAARLRFTAMGLLLCACGGCGYSDFRLPELAPAEPQVRYEWQPRDAPVLPHGAPGDWDSHDALNPSVVRRGAGYYNFYSGFDGKTWRTLLATSADGLAWNKEGVVLAPEPLAGEADYIAANGSALFDEGGFRYWYQAGPKETPRLGLARSPF